MEFVAQFLYSVYFNGLQEYFSSCPHPPVIQLTIHYSEWSEKWASLASSCIAGKPRSSLTHFYFPLLGEITGSEYLSWPRGQEYLFCHFWRRVIQVKSDSSSYPLHSIQFLLFCSTCVLGLLCWRPRLLQRCSCPWVIDSFYQRLLDNGREGLELVQEPLQSPVT